MPQIFDNLEKQLLPALRDTIALSYRGDFCVGYFSLRGWRQVAHAVAAWPGGEGHCCRVLVGMQRLPDEEERLARSLSRREQGIDQAEVVRLKKHLAEEFRAQLIHGAPNNADEEGLRTLAAQLRAGQVVVKLYLGGQLHAKLYLLHRDDPNVPVVAYVGSSNLTLAGLQQQGELNVDVVDADAGQKLAKWFDERWTDRWCVDITQELIDVLEESWAREEPIPPYHLYLKMAYHLCQEAREGLAGFRIPADFGDTLFEFQTAAVRIAAHHLNQRRGVLIGDVVGLGKTLMATALARIFEDDFDLETLIICPRNLVAMWEGYRERYRLRGRVLSLSRVTKELPHLRRYRLVVLDESHNLRNREGSRYRAIREYLRANDCRVILLSATPYNKTYLDLSSQLRLFVPEDQDLGLRPERLLATMSETEFIRRHQCPVRSLAAFEQSSYPDDWRDLMRRYLVRRTRGFIKENYATRDADGRYYLTMPDGSPMYFPVREPRRLAFAIDEQRADDQYARLYATPVVDAVNALHLPRYGLGNHVLSRLPHKPKEQEQTILDGLSRAGQRLKGFCRTNLFKRLESSGAAFLQSVERHILRNYVYLHALEGGLPLPIGTQDAELLDLDLTDTDEATGNLFDDDVPEPDAPPATNGWTSADFASRAAEVYARYAGPWHRRFGWLPAAFFQPDLATDLQADSAALLAILSAAGTWDPARDTKLQVLRDLLVNRHAGEKVLIFSQFADTVEYLADQLQRAGVAGVAGVTGKSADPTGLAWRFSPVSNQVRARVSPADELRVLIATDVLSEGQNLQDCAVVVNYDLPWAIIRLIQRAGRVDRIGQQAATIPCYSFLPADGVERIIRLRTRVRQRLRENGEVVGTDEAFFDDDEAQAVRDLYHEKAGILDGEEDLEVDLASEAYQIWKNATDADPSLRTIIPKLPAVSYSARAHQPRPGQPAGVLTYVRTADGGDALAWLDAAGHLVTQSQRYILRAAQCHPATPPVPRATEHHALVEQAAQLAVDDARQTGGGLGRPSGARYRTYERLQRHAAELQGTLFANKDLDRAIEDIYRYPLRQGAVDLLNRQLRAGISDDHLAELAIDLRADDRLCIIHDDDEALQEPIILCSLGLREG